MYDEEQIVSDLEALYKAKLNDEIDCINTQKNDIPGNPRYIEHIPDSKYIHEALAPNDKKLLNYKGFFLRFGLVASDPRNQQINNQIEDPVVNFEIATFDNGQSDLSNKFYQLIRYRRALLNVINNNNDVFRGFAKPFVTGLSPESFPYGKSKMVLAIGVSIRASITTN